MKNLWRIIPAALVCAVSLSACVSMQESAAPPAAPAPVVPAPTDDKVPAPPAVLHLPKPAAPKPVAPSSKDKNAKAAKTVAEAGKPAAEPTPSAEASAPPVATKAPSKAELALLREFPWLKNCSRRAEHAGAVQCDADALLAMPSARVQVFTRDASLLRSTANGPGMVLREGLPHRYRFFVLP